MIISIPWYYSVFTAITAVIPRVLGHYCGIAAVTAAFLPSSLLDCVVILCQFAHAAIILI